ncbi:SDR family oxidoreductase [bacterium AH-315-P15]|nr:SDR family oxidoreductase [bacterium AH-315-P15]
MEKALFEGYVALVTGAGSGIGQAVAQGLGRDGATVICAGRRLGRLEMTCRADPLLMRPVACDIARQSDIDALFQNISATEGRLDFLINAAGIYPQAALADCNPEEWRATIDINLTGAAMVMRSALNMMSARDFGRLVFLGSRSAHHPGAVTSAYSASKAGLESLTLSAAHELTWKKTTKTNILVEVLIPGQTITELLPGDTDTHNKFQRPTEVYPFVRRLLLRPKYAITGGVFYRNRRKRWPDRKLIAKQLRLILVDRLPILRRILFRYG